MFILLQRLNYTEPKYVDILQTPGLNVYPQPEYIDSTKLTLTLMINDKESLEKSINSVRRLLESKFFANQIEISKVDV